MTPTTEVEPVANLNFIKGKTIKSIKRVLNCIEIKFTDGTEIRLEAENAEFGLIGIEAYKPKRKKTLVGDNTIGKWELG